MALTSGTRLGPYEIQASLGAGGMGEVYRARDTRLDRTVAVKILPTHLSSSPEAKQPQRQILFGRAVAPLRPGLSRSFVLRRLHSLSGIVPVGAFLVEHFVSNAFTTNGPKAYGEQVRLLTGLPFLVWIEALFILIPIIFHALYGFYVWYRGERCAS